MSSVLARFKIFATVILVFHGLTLMVQELPENNHTKPENKNRSLEENWLLPPIPMTPGKLTITGYMEVIAWIGILSVNFLQLLVAVSLFNASDKQCESLKAFEASRVWLKTCIFLVIILMIKLCILYFMYEMNMQAHGTIVFTTLETIFHIVGAVIVLKFFNEIKRNNPIASRIYYQSEDSSSPKRNNVADAVWF
ncbi:unnamed protein product [Allacma fusca]|uniref:Cytochrome oxidase subunit II transmembrane region profile domain-containing protein n=1 Tax=Allacma fusca TaxID=39272 RepID=A0A8J2LDP0_9HEXA|nr:unnamed protein product [Allacma fusca]